MVKEGRRAERGQDWVPLEEFGRSVGYFMNPFLEVPPGKLRKD